MNGPGVDGRAWPPGDGEMARRIRAHDWAATLLGPEGSWPRSLRGAVELMLPSALPMLVAWGPGLIQIYNDAMRPLVGSNHPRAFGRGIREAWPETWSVNGPLYARALSGVAVTSEDMVLSVDRGDGPREAWFTGTFSPLHDDAGTPGGVMAAVVDTTARVLAERALRVSEKRGAFLLRLSDALRPLTDAGDMRLTAARVLGEALDGDRAYFGDIDPDGRSSTARPGFVRGGGPSAETTHPTDSYAEIFAALREGRTFAVDDVSNAAVLSPATRQTYAAVGFAAFVCVPLPKPGRALWTLSVACGTPRAWTGADVDLVRETLERTWDAVERARAEAALRNSEARFRALVTAGAYSIYRMSPDWRFMFQLESRTLAPTAAPIEDWLDKYILPEDRPTVDAAVNQAIRTRSLFELEHRVRAADQGVTWVVSRAVPILGADGGILEWFGAGADVTERRTAVEELKRTEQRYRTELEQEVKDRTEEVARSHDLLKATMDSSLDMIQVFRAVRDGNGGIVDFEWVLNNHASEKHYGNIIGQRLLRRNPGVVEEGIFDMFRQVVETGRPGQAERHYVHEQFDGWFFQSAVRMGDGVATTTKEISDWKAAQAEVLNLQEEVAQARLRESEERLRQFGEVSQDILWIRDAGTLQWTYLTPAFEAIYGLSREEALSGDNYRNWQDLILPEDRAHAISSIARVVAGERTTFEYRIRRPVDGQVRWLRNTDFPLPDAAGRVVRIGGVGHDITALKASQAAMAASELRLRTLTEGIPQLVWRSSAEGLWTWCSPQWTAFTGQGQEDSHGQGWLAAVHPDDHAAARRAWDDAQPHGRLDVEYRVRRAADGAWLWHHTRSVPVRDAPGPNGMAGPITEWLGTTTDIDDLKRLQGQQQVLVAELQHRTRNLLAVVRNVARRSIGPSPGRDEYDARLSALGRVQGFLSRSPVYSVPLADVVEAELRATGDGASGKAGIGGVPVHLPGESVQAVALALHELATNAAKYGALAQPSARLSVTWRVAAGADDAPELVIDWRESGVTMQDRPPARSGYGTELITRALPYQLGAKTTLEFTPDGVRCRIILPAKAVSGWG